MNYVEKDISVRESERKLVDGEDQDAEYSYYEEDYYSYESDEGKVEEQADVTGV